MLMYTILGAGGAIGNELVKELTRKGKQVRLVVGRRDRLSKPRTRPNANRQLNLQIAKTYLAGTN